ncbi:hypothetical protein KCU83_g235, partial [Aureobasidium melanogenum]
LPRLRSRAINDRKVRARDFVEFCKHAKQLRNSEIAYASQHTSALCQTANLCIDDVRLAKYRLLLLASRGSTRYLPHERHIRDLSRASQCGWGLSHPRGRSLAQRTLPDVTGEYLARSCMKEHAAALAMQLLDATLDGAEEQLLPIQARGQHRGYGKSDSSVLASRERTRGHTRLRAAHEGTANEMSRRHAVRFAAVLGNSSVGRPCLWITIDVHCNQATIGIGLTSHVWSEDRWFLLFRVRTYNLFLVHRPSSNNELGKTYIKSCLVPGCEVLQAVRMVFDTASQDSVGVDITLTVLAVIGSILILLDSSLDLLVGSTGSAVSSDQFGAASFGKISGEWGCSHRRLGGGRTGASDTALLSGVAGNVGVSDLELLLVDSELNWSGSSHGTKVVHAGLQAELPTSEVHAGNLTHSRSLHVNVERLRLVDEGTTVSGHLNNVTLAEFPNGLVQSLEVVRNVGNALDRTTVGNDAVLHVVRPKATVNKGSKHSLKPMICEPPSPRDWRASIGLVRTKLLSQIARSSQSGVIDGLEDLDVELSSLGRVERHAKSEEGVSESTNTKTNGTVAEVALASLRDRVVVDLNDLVQVLGNNLDNLVKLLEVELVFVHVDEGGKSKGSQVADGDLIRSSVLDNLSTQVGAANDTKVLLVALAVASILVQHERVTSLGLSLEDSVPQLLGTDGIATTAFALVLLVQSLELFAVNVGQTRTFSGAHQGPGGVLLDTLHEEIGDPKSVEEIAGTDFLLTVVLAKVEEGEDVGVPGLEIDGEGTGTLVAALVDVSGSVVENTEHGYETVGCAVGTSNIMAQVLRVSGWVSIAASISSPWIPTATRMIICWGLSATLPSSLRRYERSRVLKPNEDGVVGVGGCHVCSSLGSQVIELDGVDALVDTSNHLHGDSSSVNMVRIEAVTQPRDAGCDLVELDTLLASVCEIVSIFLTRIASRVAASQIEIVPSATRSITLTQPARTLQLFSRLLVDAPDLPKQKSLLLFALIP